MAFSLYGLPLAWLAAMRTMLCTVYAVWRGQLRMNHEEGVAIGPLFRFGQLFVQTIWPETVAIAQHTNTEKK